MINKYEKGDGKTCDTKDGGIDSSNCPLIPCPIDCKGDWSDWSYCDQDICGKENQQKRTRTFNIENKDYDGSNCEFQDGETQEKNCPLPPPCPVDCIGDWSDWEDCPPVSYTHLTLPTKA